MRWRRMALGRMLLIFYKPKWYLYRLLWGALALNPAFAGVSCFEAIPAAETPGLLETFALQTLNPEGFGLGPELRALWEQPEVELLTKSQIRNAPGSKVRCVWGLRAGRSVGKKSEYLQLITLKYDGTHWAREAPGNRVSQLGEMKAPDGAWRVPD